MKLKMDHFSIQIYEMYSNNYKSEWVNLTIQLNMHKNLFNNKISIFYPIFNITWSITIKTRRCGIWISFQINNKSNREGMLGY